MKKKKFDIVEAVFGDKTTYYSQKVFGYISMVASIGTMYHALTSKSVVLFLMGIAIAVLGSHLIVKTKR